MNKKEYIKPVSVVIRFGDDLMELGGLSIQGKNTETGEENIFAGIGGEGDMEKDARAKNFTSVWEDDAFTGHIPDELFD
ncbi:MAG: hypothetical protein J6M37_01695 [Prevotella sp.]|nr:hypothetical protein [Prevotella sp.]